MTAGYPSNARDFLLEQVPDEPENVDLRGLLLAGDVEILPVEIGAAGYAIYAPGIDIACLWGTPPPEVIDALVPRVRRGTQVVCEEAQRQTIESKFEALRAERLHLFGLPAGVEATLPADRDEGSVRVVDSAGDISLAHLPAPLRAEIEAVLSRKFVAMTFVDDLAVSFCYPHHETERFWDVSVDTIEAYRKQGHAACAFGVAHEVLRAQGKAPVWGALESNAASSALARRLGFEEVAVRYVLISAGASGRS